MNFPGLNLSHLQYPDKGWGYLPSTQEVFEAFRFCQRTFKPKSVLEIGFHIGHSTTYILEFFVDIKTLISISPDNEIIGKGEDRIDPQIRRDMAKYLSEYYKGKFEWLPGTTQELHEKLHDYFFDFALVDGNHHEDKAAYDFETCAALAIPHILVDNWDQGGVKRGLEKSGAKYKLMKNFDYTQTFKGKTKTNRLAAFYLA